jgi:UDP-glucose 4-epimerase
MKTVVVLGGSGFVGRRLCPSLAEAGCTVYSISRSPVIKRSPSVNYIDCNFDNVYQLGELYQRADVIFHLACDTTPATSSQQSSLEVTANLLPSLRLLEYLEHHCKARLVFVSSGGTIYGDAGHTPCTEQSTMDPISYYGASKASLEFFLHAYSRQTENPVVILRPSNIYGPGQLAKQQFGFVPTLLNAIKNGDSFRLMGDGENVRDFLFIDDFVQLCQALVQSDMPAGSPLCSTFNVGSGIGVSLNKVIALAEAATSGKVMLDHTPVRKVDVRSIILNSSKANEVFGWAAQTALEDGLRQTWEWMVAD